MESGLDSYGELPMFLHRVKQYNHWFVVLPAGSAEVM